MYHKHQYSGISSFNEGHEHCYCSETTTGLDNTNHSHCIKGITSYTNGHCHTYCITSEKDIQVPGGGHVHLYNGFTEIADGHVHHITGYTLSD